MPSVDVVNILIQFCNILNQSSIGLFIKKFKNNILIIKTGCNKNCMTFHENSNCSIEVYFVRNSSFETQLFSDEKCFFLMILANGTISGILNHVTYTFHSSMFICLKGSDAFKLITVSNNAKLYIVKFTDDIIAGGFLKTILSDKNSVSLRDKYYAFQLAPFMAERIKDRCVFIHKELLPTCINLCRQLEILMENCHSEKDVCAAMFYFEQLLASLTAAVHGYGIHVNEGQKLYKPDDFQKILDYIDQNLNRPLTLNHISKQFYIGTNAIERRFEAYCGMSFKAYVSQKRFELARYQLAYTTRSNKEIAANIGFAYAQSFSTFFKNMSGMTPGEYRKLS